MTAYHLIIGITLISAGALLGWIGVAGRRGTLKPNSWIGIRTSALLASERTWRAGHKAAAPQFLAAGAGVLLAGLFCLFLPFDAVTAVSTGSTVWLLIFVAWGGSKANKAAEQA